VQRAVVNGKQSTWSNVKSGVPQGTILGPVLFITFINDISENLTSNTKLYANDCLLYSAIASDADYEIMKCDLRKLEYWCSNWLLTFNVSKCKVLYLTRSRRHIEQLYFLYGKQLESSNCETYLGVELNSRLKGGDHCHKLANKCNKLLGFIRRILRHAESETIENVYKIGLC